MGRIRVSNNPFETNGENIADYEHTGPFIDWLLKNYPEGLPAEHMVTFNNERIFTEDYDVKIGPDDVVMLAIAPGWMVGAAAPLWIKIAALIVNTAISMAISYAVNKLFGPKASSPNSLEAVSTQDTPTAGSVYSLTTPTNVARIGEVIPVGYGKNWIYPNQGMQPYTYFENNEQFLCQIQCIGLGDYEIHSVKVGGSYATEMSEDIFKYWIYTPTEHRSKFGTIQNDTGIFENVYTSSEISDQELTAGFSADASTVNLEVWNGCWPNGGCDSYSVLGLILLHSENPQLANLTAEKDVYLIFDEGPNAGKVWGPIFIVNDKTQTSRDFLRYKAGHLPRSSSGNTLWDGSYKGHASYTLNKDILDQEGSGGEIGPFAASPPCMLTTHIQFDLVMPGGCYKANDDGTLGEWEIEVQFVVEEIDNLGVPTGNSYTQVWSDSFATNTPQRVTIDMEVPKSRYRAKARRLTPLSERAQDSSKIYWTGLKSILGPYCDSVTPVYAKSTLLVSRIRATQGIASGATNRLAVNCSRKIDGTVTRNPMDAFVDIYTNKHYGAGRPTSELDTTEINAIKSLVSNCSFDGVFDQRTSVYEAMKLAGQMIRGIPIQKDGVLSMVRDAPKSVPIAGFNEDNIIRLTRSYEFANIDDADGLEGEYIDPLDSTKQYVVYPSNASSPDSVVLWGCTSRARAECVLQQLWNQRKYRRQMISFEVEMDAHTIYFGDAINVQHRLLGSSPVLHVVSGISFKDDFTATIEAFRYDHRVYE